MNLEVFIKNSHCVRSKLIAKAFHGRIGNEQKVSPKLDLCTAVTASRSSEVFNSVSRPLAADLVTSLNCHFSVVVILLYLAVDIEPVGNPTLCKFGFTTYLCFRMNIGRANSKTYAQLRSCESSKVI